MWRDAIHRALAKRSKGDQVQALDDLAEKFLSAVDKGDISAFKELGDRLDGKPEQVLQGDSENPLYFQEIVRKIEDPRT